MNKYSFHIVFVFSIFVFSSLQSVAQNCDQETQQNKLSKFSKELNSCPDLAQQKCSVRPTQCGEVQQATCLPKAQEKSASEIKSLFRGLQGDAREKEIKKLAVEGSFPEGLKKLKSVDVPLGKDGNIKIFVAPDYFALGTNQDNLLMPMTNETAQDLADVWGMSLPSSKIVDQIYHSADLQLKASPFPPDHQMVSTDRYIESDTKIKTQYPKSHSYGDRLIVGHKKDLIIAPEKGRVRIYGWASSGMSRAKGRMPYIQPESNAHDSKYVDYAHGARFMNRWIEVQENGQCKVISFQEALTDKRYCPSLSYTCPLSAEQTRGTR